MTVKTGGASAPPSLDELWALRTDYEDVTVPELGGTVLRVYALTGTARAELFSEMSDLVGVEEADPQAVRRVFLFQSQLVAVSLGYPREQWGKLGDVLGMEVIERLYAIVQRLSGLDTTEATERLRPRRSAASGTG